MISITETAHGRDSLTDGDVSVVESPSSNTWYKIPNDGRNHTLGPWYAYYIQSGQTIPNSKVSGCKVGPTLPGSGTLSASSSRAVVCTESGSCIFDNVLFNLSFSVPPNTYPGTYDLSCLVSGINVTKLGQVTVYDATPVITPPIQQEPPDIQGQPFYVTITGSNFGPQPGSVTVCASNSTSCDQTPDLTVCLPIYDSTQSAARRNENCPEARWSGNSIHVLVRPSNANVVGTYDVTVTSVGAGLGGPLAFNLAQANGTNTSATSGRSGTISVQPPLPIKLFIVHGLGDSASSMAGLATTLRGLQAAGGLNSNIDIDYMFDYPNTECRFIQGNTVSGPLGVDDRLADYVRNNTSPGQRVAFIGHSMGGLVIRSLMARRLLFLGSASRRVMGFATLGTPHLGYPYLTIDDQAHTERPNICMVQQQQMASTIGSGASLTNGMLNPLNLGGFPVPPLLPQLQSDTSSNPSYYQGNWFAAGGRSCSTQSRNFPVVGYDNPITTNGCPGLNDNVVCLESATTKSESASYPGTSLSPSLTWSDPGYNYQHSADTGSFFLNVMCATSNSDSVFPLPNPPLVDFYRTGGLLESLVKYFLNGL